MWKDKYLKEALDDLDNLDSELREIVLAGIKKVRQNPLPQSEGGYGNPLGNKNGNNLTGFFKIKYKGKNDVYEAEFSNLDIKSSSHIPGLCKKI